MEIHACPKCGSKNIQIGTLGSGVTYGITSWKSVCRNCGYQGEPLLFDSEENYDKFVQGLSTKEKPSQEDLAEQKEPQSTEEDDLVQLSEKDKNVVKCLHEIEEEPEQQIEKEKEKVFSEDKVWWPEIGLAMIIAIIITYLWFAGAYTYYNIILISIYGICTYILFTIISLIGIVLVEYLYYSLKRK
ncbi:MAG: hypothetical protein V1726_08325 [Methanobacteriota archaeon]